MIKYTSAMFTNLKKKKTEKIHLKMLDGAPLFKEHAIKWTQNTAKYPKQWET